MNKFDGFKGIHTYKYTEIIGFQVSELECLSLVGKFIMKILFKINSLNPVFLLFFSRCFGSIQKKSPLLNNRTTSIQRKIPANYLHFLSSHHIQIKIKNHIFLLLFSSRFSLLAFLIVAGIY
jgi:hypothetical protein